MSVFADSQQNIENKIAEAKQEADDYRKRWESQHTKVLPDRFLYEDIWIWFCFAWKTIFPVRYGAVDCTEGKNTF